MFERCDLVLSWLSWVVFGCSHDDGAWCNGRPCRRPPDAKVTDDNNNIDGGLENVTPSKDAQNRQSNETSVAISGAASPVTGQLGDIIAEAANDYRMVPHTADVWIGFHLSFDGGTTWFGPPPFPNGYNTFVPGFPTDTSP